MLAKWLMKGDGHQNRVCVHFSAIPGPIIKAVPLAKASNPSSERAFHCFARTWH